MLRTAVACNISSNDLRVFERTDGSQCLLIALLVKQAPRSGLHHGYKVESGEVSVVLDLLSGR